MSRYAGLRGAVALQQHAGDRHRTTRRKLDRRVGAADRDTRDRDRVVNQVCTSPSVGELADLRGDLKADASVTHNNRCEFKRNTEVAEVEPDFAFVNRDREREFSTSEEAGCFSPETAVSVGSASVRMTLCCSKA